MPSAATARKATRIEIHTGDRAAMQAITREEKRCLENRCYGVLCTLAIGLVGATAVAGAGTPGKHGDSLDDLCDARRIRSGQRSSPAP